MNKLMVVLPLILLLAGCNQGAPAGDPALITSRAAEWDVALNAGDIDAVAALYTDNARLLAPNAEMTVGLDGIRATFGGMIDAGLSGKLTGVEARVSGDIGYRVGRYALSAGGKEVDVGKFVETWERGTDGVWRISNDIYNSDRPASSANAHLLIVHEVENADRWMAAWRGEDSRHKLFADNGAAHVHNFRSVDNPNLTGLVINVSDMGALQEMLESAEGVAAAEQDGVRKNTVKILFEAQ